MEALIRAQVLMAMVTDLISVQALVVVAISGVIRLGEVVVAVLSLVVCSLEVAVAGALV